MATEHRTQSNVGTVRSLSSPVASVPRPQVAVVPAPTKMTDLPTMHHVLARCSPEERSRLEETLAIASLSLWRVRQALGPAGGPSTSLAAWRTALHSVVDACAVAEDTLASDRTAGALR